MHTEQKGPLWRAWNAAHNKVSSLARSCPVVQFSPVIVYSQVASYVWHGKFWHIFAMEHTVYGKNIHRGKYFVIFHSIVNLLLWIMALSVGNVSLHKCYSKSFIVNSYFPFKMWKFSIVDVYPYAVIFCSTCIDKSYTVATVHFLWQNPFVQVCGYLCTIYCCILNNSEPFYTSIKYTKNICQGH